MKLPIPEREFLKLIASGDSVGLWQMAEMAGLYDSQGRYDSTSRLTAIDDIVATLEGPLVRGSVVPVRIYSGPLPAELINEPIDELIARIRGVLGGPVEPDWVEVDINFDVPARLRPLDLGSDRR